MEATTKTCSKCTRTLPLSEYRTQKTSPDGLRYECKDCQKQYMATWRSENRQRMRDHEARRRATMSEEEKARKRELDLARYHADPSVARDKILRKKYGISQAEYDAMLEKQGGVCRICGGTNGPRILHVDHHHGTGAVRGLLCTNCNTGLGMFQDNPNFLSQAMTYLLST